MSTQRPRREDPKAAARAAKKQAMEARLKSMEVERLKMNTFLKESGYVRHPVAEDGDCCYLAILGSLGVLPPGEVANPGSSSLRAVKVLREMAYASVTGTSILDEADLEAFHESIPSHFVRKNSRNKNDVKNMDKRGDIFTKLLEYHIPLGRWSDSLSLQPFMVAGAGWWLQCDIYSISMAHGVANMVTTNSRVTFNEEKQRFEPMPNPGTNDEDGPRFMLPYFSKDERIGYWTAARTTRVGNGRILVNFMTMLDIRIDENPDFLFRQLKLHTPLAPQLLVLLTA